LDFRTWAGTVLAAMALNELESFDSAAQAKRNLRAAIEKVASRLGNTPTICRKCCVHPEVLSSYMDGNLVLELKSQAESELVGAIGSLKRKRPPSSHCCAVGWRKKWNDLKPARARPPSRPREKDDERERRSWSYLSFFANDLAPSLIACSATLGPFQPSILSFLSSSSSVAIKNFSSSS
jgi:hypothetical protein